MYCNCLTVRFKNDLAVFHKLYMIVHAVLDMPVSNSGNLHKPCSNVVDVMSPPPSAFCLLGSESSSTPACAPPPPFQTKLPVSDGLMCANVHKSFHWPGIDAVMESYQLYLEGSVSLCVVLPLIREKGTVCNVYDVCY